MGQDEIMAMIQKLDSRLEKLEDLPARLERLETLPNAIERLSMSIDAHTQVFATSVPLPVVRWIFVIVVILIGGRWGLQQFDRLLG